MLTNLPPDCFLIAPAFAGTGSAYDAKWIRDPIEQRDAVPMVPDRERAFNKLKQFRRFATRYEKLAASFLATIKIVTVRFWQRACEFTVAPNRR